MHLAQGLHCKCTQLRMYISNFIWHRYEQPDEHRWRGHSEAQQATHKSWKKEGLFLVFLKCTAVIGISCLTPRPRICHRFPTGFFLTKVSQSRSQIRYSYPGYYTRCSAVTQACHSLHHHPHILTFMNNKLGWCSIIKVWSRITLQNLDVYFSVARCLVAYKFPEH